MKLPPARWSPAALIELLTVKKQCKRIFHGNEWMKEHNYAFQNADTRPRLQSRTQNICFVISISAVILKRMVKITSIFGSYRFLRIAWHDIFSLSYHLLASWNLCIPRVPFYVFGIYFLFSFCCCCCFLIVVVAVIFVNYNGNRL